MGYNTKIAGKSFKTAPTGERVFLPDGIRSPGYVIPDEITEKQLYTKLLWVHYGMVGEEILLRFFLLALYHQHMFSGSFFLAFVAGPLLIQWVTWRLAFRRDLSNLSQISVPDWPVEDGFSFENSFSPKPVHRRELALFTGFTGSVLFVITEMSMLHSSGHAQALGSAAVLFSTLAAFGWGYAFYLKSQKQKTARLHDPRNLL